MRAPELSVSLKSEPDILMAFGVSTIVSAECVGCDSNELAQTSLQHYVAFSCPPLVSPLPHEDHTLYQCYHIIQRSVLEVQYAPSNEALNLFYFSRNADCLCWSLEMASDLLVQTDALVTVTCIYNTGNDLAW